MAFPVPSHLPRRPKLNDVSSEILAKFDQATNQTLTATLATSWLAELEATIQTTKSQIHDRIHLDLPKFDQQLESSKSVQTRLRSLVSNVDELNHTLSNPETGLVPALVRSLTAHATLAQQSTDATVRHNTLLHLLRCRAEFTSVLLLVQIGKLPQAVEACREFDQLLHAAPPHLSQTSVMLDLKHQFQAAKSRVEEQLSEGYSRSVVVSPRCLTILSSVVVRESQTVLSLSEILTSLSTSSLSSHLTTLRRDIMTHYVDYLLQQPASLTITSKNLEHRLTLFPSPPNSEDLTTRLDNVSATLDFLSTQVIAVLPASETLAFSRSLCKPIATSVLSNLLIPSLPSSFESLPRFIGLAKHAVAFEDKYIVRLLGDDKCDCPIEGWVDGISGHYERQRRMQILETSRTIILAPEFVSDRFYVEIDIFQEKTPEVVPVQEKDHDDTSWAFEEPINGGSSESPDEQWGFDDRGREQAAGPPVNQDPSGAVDDGWGFDADPEPAAAAEPSTAADIEDGWGFDVEEVPASPVTKSEPLDTSGHDTADAWGWKDDAPPESTADTAWDDPWDDPPEKPSAVKVPPKTFNKSPLSSPASVSSPKMATRLEKLANKSKKHLNGNSPMSSPALPTSTSMSSIHAPAETSRPSPPATVKSHGKRPPQLTSPNVVPKETYSVSGRMRQIIHLVEDVLAEGQKFAASKIFPAVETGSPPGTVLLQSASSIPDLYRALYPVKSASRLVTIPDAPMQFSNDCLYLSGEIARMEMALKHGAAPVKERLVECQHRLKVTGESWFEDTVERHRNSIEDTILQGAEGFTFLVDQERYDQCETALSRVVQEIKKLAQQWKNILNKSKYYSAIGILTDVALSRMLEDVLALPDIPADESHRLRELSRILSALEALFIEDTNQASFGMAE
ncbi:hypothetical protein GGX14DRAFT_648787 [Mycena pura]|uniref:Retrograde transport protein Dsl1 C-terminal domain-containing protein n=1 Tax=Mycena pura TaxID=153505 RepID=A0AAD7E1R4_9AGAR|nr:hypothetical protein GGX14DRAFT_648787 [Mycena pura]